VQLQLTRKPHPLPKVTIADKPFFDLEFEDFKLEGYVHEPFIKFPVAV
jgi:thymidylate synthase